MLPVIALVGRPNVGKSTLFNRLTRTREALVANYAGLTRDRKYGEGKLGHSKYIVIDTGGINQYEQNIDKSMVQQTLQAITEADVIFFIVDAHLGYSVEDESISNMLRKQNKNVWLIINKSDSANYQQNYSEFYKLGSQQIYPITATHGKGVESLINDVLDSVSQSFIFRTSTDKTLEVTQNDAIKIAIIGRPNVGKSTLINQLLGQERVVVYDQAGTTRDSIYIPYEKDGQQYTLIDTAGVRRKGKVCENIEKFSVVKALQAMEDSNVVILVFDAREGIVDQDLHMLRYALDAGKSIIIGMNKWDKMSHEEKAYARHTVDRRLVFIDFAPVYFISAKRGSGVGKMFNAVKQAYQSAMKTWSSSDLTEILQALVKEHEPPMIQGRRIKLKYCHMAGSNPPFFIIHGNQTAKLPKAYTKYLENKFRLILKIEATPIKIQYKTSENPFADKKNKLTQRQIQKRKRLLKFVKKNKK